MTNRMTPAQRRQHYDDWLASGMSKSTYAQLHGINTKTFWHLCRALAPQKTHTPAKNTLLPVTLTDSGTSDVATLSLRAASVTSTPAGIAALIRELRLC